MQRQASKPAYYAKMEVFSLIKNMWKNLVIPHRGAVNIFCKCSQINECFLTDSAALVIFPVPTHGVKNDTVWVLTFFTVISNRQCKFRLDHMFTSQNPEKGRRLIPYFLLYPRKKSLMFSLETLEILKVI